MYSNSKFCLEVKASLCFALVLVLVQQELVKISLLCMMKYLSYYCMICNYHAKAVYCTSSTFKNVESNFISFIYNKNNFCDS